MGDKTDWRLMQIIESIVSVANARFKDIGFLDHDDWYVIKKIDKYNSIIELTSKAPTEAENECVILYIKTQEKC